MDVKFLERIPGTGKRLYQFTAIDDCTRIRVLKVYDACNQRTAIRFIDEVLRRLPFRVHVVQTDNGAEFQSQFHWHLEARDIRHVYIRPRTPHLNGKVERSHRVDDQEFYQLLDRDGITDDIHLFNDKLREWEDYYNYHRPHGALGGPDPVRAARRKNESWSVTEVLRPYRHPCDRNRPAKNGRDDWIRTSDPLTPSQVRYQAAPHPEIFAESTGETPVAPILPVTATPSLPLLLRRRARWSFFRVRAASSAAARLFLPSSRRLSARQRRTARARRRSALRLRRYGEFPLPGAFRASSRSPADRASPAGSARARRCRAARRVAAPLSAAPAARPDSFRRAPASVSPSTNNRCLIRSTRSRSARR